MTIHFTVMGAPKGQPRPRAFARKMGDKFVARVYEAGTAEAWKGQIAVAARPHIPKEPLTGPLRFRLHLFFPRPKKHFLKNGLRADAPIYHTSKPDFDNCAKAVCDALTTLRFYEDDAQICGSHVIKFYEQPGGFSGCSIALEKILTE